MFKSGLLPRELKIRIALAGLVLLLLSSAGAFGLLYYESHTRQQQLEETRQALLALKEPLLTQKARNPNLLINVNLMGLEQRRLRDPATGAEFLVEPEGPGADIVLLQPMRYRVGLWPEGRRVRLGLLRDGRVVDVLRDEPVAQASLAAPARQYPQTQADS